MGRHVGPATWTSGPCRWVRAGRPADRRPRRHDRVVAVPARRAGRPLRDHGLRQPRRGPHADAEGGQRGDDGRRRRRGPACARHPARTCRASRAAASSARNWRCDTPTWCAASSCRAPGAGLDVYLRGGRGSSGGSRAPPRASRSCLETSSWPSTRRGPTTTARSIRRWGIDAALAIAYKQSPEDAQRTLDAFMTHRTIDRLHQIRRPLWCSRAGSTPRPTGAGPRRRRCDPRCAVRGSRRASRTSRSRRSRTGGTRGSTRSGRRSSGGGCT